MPQKKRSLEKMYQRDVKLLDFAVLSLGSSGQGIPMHFQGVFGFFSSVFFIQLLALTFSNMLFLLVDTGFLVPEWASGFGFQDAVDKPLQHTL